MLTCTYPFMFMFFVICMECTVILRTMLIYYNIPSRFVVLFHFQLYNYCKVALLVPCINKVSVIRLSSSVLLVTQLYIFPWTLTKLLFVQNHQYLEHDMNQFGKKCHPTLCQSHEILETVISYFILMYLVMFL